MAKTYVLKDGFRIDTVHGAFGPVNRAFAPGDSFTPASPVDEYVGALIEAANVADVSEPLLTAPPVKKGA